MESVDFPTISLYWKQQNILFGGQPVDSAPSIDFHDAAMVN